MADFHKHVGIVKRSEGRCATAAAAYRAGACIEDRRTGQVFDYTNKRDVVSTDILAPEGAPAWVYDRAELWNRVEEGETRKDSQLARTYELALPRELPRDDRRDLVKSFIHDQCVSAGMIADIAIHENVASDGEAQPHAHVMLTMRHLGPDGFEGKAREWNPDFKNTKGGHGFVADTSPLIDLRGKWAEYANHELERAGSTERIDHRSLADRRAEALEQASDPTASAAQRAAAAIRAEKLDREPQKKLGPNVQAMEHRGIETERAEQNREIRARNIERDKLQREYAEVCRKLGLDPEQGRSDPVAVASRADPVRKSAHQQIAAQLKRRAAEQAAERQREKDWRAARTEATKKAAERMKQREADKAKGGSKSGDAAKDKAEREAQRKALAERLERQKQERHRPFGREHER